MGVRSWDCGDGLEDFGVGIWDCVFGIEDVGVGICKTCAVDLTRQRLPCGKGGGFNRCAPSAGPIPSAIFDLSFGELAGH